MSGEIEIYEPDDLPPLMADIQASDAISLSRRPEVSAVEEGLRTWPDGMTENYRRVEFR